MNSNSFTDSKTRVWTCRITWAALRRSTAAGVDLSIVEDHLGDFYRGSPKMLDALWAVLSEDANTQNVDRDDFENSITGDTIESARDALLQGLKDFFPSQRAALIAAAAEDVKTQIEKLISPKPSTPSPGSSE